MFAYRRLLFANIGARAAERGTGVPEQRVSESQIVVCVCECVCFFLYSSQTCNSAKKVCKSQSKERPVIVPQEFTVRGRNLYDF